MKIALTGATGKLGSIVLRHLLYRKNPNDITVGVRRPQNAVHLTERGIAVKYCDYDDPASLEPYFKDASKFLLISSPHRDDSVRLKQHTAAIHAAQRAGVGHIAYTSIAYAERGRLPEHRLHLETEQIIRESGIPYTILRNAFYMDIIHMLRVREAVSSGRLVSPPGEWTFNTADREDLAQAAAAVLTEAGHENRTYELTASKVWKMDDLAHALTEATGRRVVHISDPAASNELFGLLPYSDMKSVSPDLKKLVGRPLRTVHDAVRSLFV